MHPEPTVPKDGTIVASGYGLKIYISRGHLIVNDGIGRHRQVRRFHRATSRLKRLVVIGHTGYITLDALRWLHDIGAAMVQIDSEGQLITTSAGKSTGLASLRRAQALASTTSTGLEIARGLLQTKVGGQAALLDELPRGPRARDEIESALAAIASASDLRSLIGAEAHAAAAYWQAWATLATPMGDRDGAGTPAHWRTFGQRHSPLTSSPRLACNPPNAILNYLYALLEAETILACHAVGLDPALGILHTDQRNRSSLALDAIEAVRPIADAYLLALLTQRTLARADFIETRQGACRLTPTLAARLAATIPTWRVHVAPIVERIAHALVADSPRRIAIAAPLTHAQHHAAWDERAPGRERRQPVSATLALPNTCRDCGTHLPDRRRRYCDHCRAQRWTKHASQGRDTAATVLMRLRAEQRDPAHGGRAAEIRGTKNAAHQAAVRGWTGEQLGPEVFRIEILPGLRRKPISELSFATGLSDHYCSLIRLGKQTPHARHWNALRQLGTDA